MVKKIKNKRGLSEVISNLLIVMLTLVVIAGLWVFVNNFVLDKLGTAKKCSGVAGKIEFGDSTCYTYNDVTNELNLTIALNRKDLNMDGVLIAVKPSNGDTKSFKIMADGSSVYDYVKNLGDSGYNPLIIPQEDEGRSYIFNFGYLSPKPETISLELAPIIEKEYCTSVDMWNSVPACA